MPWRAARRWLAPDAVIAVATVAAWLASSNTAIAACVAIAVFGMPHGALDIELLTRARRSGAERFESVLALYLACAGAMASLWWLAPLLALTLFLVIAVVHFSEDWAASDSRFLQHGTALALLAAPALLHRSEITTIFVTLTRSPDAALLGDALLIVAPVACVVAVAAIAAMVADGRIRNALAASISMLALALLPPAPGFAVYFCLFHSPRHFGAALRVLGWSHPRQWAPVVIPVTAAALAITSLLFAVMPVGGVPARLVSAVFMTLSVVTLPHLVVPLLLDLTRSPPRPRATATSSGR